MKKNAIAIVAFSLVLAACGGRSEKKDPEQKKEEWVPKPITAGNVTGTWKIVMVNGEEKGDKMGKTIEFTTDSVFYFKEDGSPVHRKMELNDKGAKIETITKGDDGSVTTFSSTSVLSFNDDGSRLSFYIYGEAYDMVKQ